MRVFETEFKIGEHERHQALVLVESINDVEAKVHKTYPDAAVSKIQDIAADRDMEIIV